MTSMLDHTHTSDTPAGKKADKRKQTILVIVGVVGVLLTYLLYRRSQNSAASQTAAQPATAGGMSDTGASGGASAPDMSGLLNSIGSEIAQNAATIAQLQSNQTADEAAFQTDHSFLGRLTQTVHTLKETVASQEQTIAQGLAPHGSSSPVPQPSTHTSSKKTAVQPSGSKSAAQHYYTVESGDTLSGIASQYHESWQTLYAANRGAVGSNPNLIHPGLRLVVP